jgi:hypothetical protein
MFPLVGIVNDPAGTKVPQIVMSRLETRAHAACFADVHSPVQIPRLLVLPAFFLHWMFNFAQTRIR